VANVNWRYLYHDSPANDDVPDVRLHWVDWSRPPEFELVKPVIRKPCEVWFVR